jgi:hypothetical protein
MCPRILAQRPLVNLDLAPFAFTVRALRARTVNAGFGGAKRRRNQLVENAARSELMNYTPHGKGLGLY